MKKTIAILTLMLFGLFVFGQTKDFQNHFNKENEIYKKYEKTNKENKNSFKRTAVNNKNASASKLRKLSSRTNPERIDSAIFNWGNGKDKIQFTYDEAGNMTQWIYFDWDNNKWEGDECEQFIFDTKGLLKEYYAPEWNDIKEIWENDWKEEYWYNSKDNLVLIEMAEWNEAYKLWILNRKEEYSYDANENLIVEEAKKWDNVNSQWTNYNKNEYTYDINNNLTKEIEYEWDDFTNNYINYQKYEYTYDANEKLTMELDFVWNGSNWITGNKEEYDFDANGNLIMEKSSWYHNYYSIWIPRDKSEYTYDANDNQTLRIDSNWIDSISQWHFESKEEYFVNSNGQDTLEIYTYWDEYDKQYYKGKSEYTYDINKNLIKEIEYGWDDSTSQYELDEKVIYTFDLSVKISDLILPPEDFLEELYFEEDYCNNKLLECNEYEWDSDNNNWDLENGIDYYYSEHKSQVGDQDICMVTVDSSTSKNLIAWEREQSTDIDGYKVYKETFQANVYDSIGYVPYNKLSVFIDTSSRPAVRANRYKVSTIFNDGNESYLSKHHKTIHLTANTGTSGENNLIWSHYEGFTFSSYKIYRGTNPANISLLDSVPSNLTSYTDVNPPAGVVFYQVVVDLPYICDPSIFRAQGTSGPFSHSLSNLKDYSQSSNDYLIISPSAVSIDINARIFYLTVFTNLKTWSVTADQSWLTVIEDIDGGRILVNVDKNTETSERTAEITVSGSGVSNFNISLTQGITNSVEEELKDDFIVVTPNPFTDKLSVNNLSIANDILKIELYDLNGKRYFQSENPELFTEIDCSDLKSGMYILKAISKDKAYTYLLVKQ